MSPMIPPPEFDFEKINPPPVPTLTDPGIGTRVKVIAITDNSINPAFIGMIGTVIGFDHSGLCGSTPADPLFFVLFSPNTTPESFWGEEITADLAADPHPNRRRFAR